MMKKRYIHCTRGDYCIAVPHYIMYRYVDLKWKNIKLYDKIWIYVYSNYYIFVYMKLEPCFRWLRLQNMAKRHMKCIV